MGRRGVLVFVVTLVSGLIWTIAPVRANGAAGHEDAFAQQANAERAAGGLTSFAAADDLVEVARRHSQRMASEGRLHHNPSLGSEVQGWQAVGENVGVGASVESIHRAFMESPTHRDNLLSATFTEAGVGAHVDDEGSIWVTQVFRTPQAASSAGPAPVEQQPAEVAQPQPAPAASAPTPPPVEPAAPPAAVDEPRPGSTVSSSDPRAEAEVAAMAEAFAAASSTSPGPSPVRSTVVTGPAGRAPGASASSAVVGGDTGRRVTLPIGVAASFLLAVVLGLLAEVGRYPLSAWRRQRNQASMSSSRSPSSTAWTFPVS